MATAISLAHEDKVNQLINYLYLSCPEPATDSGKHCPYDAIDPALLLFLNTTGCRWHAGLACFDDKAWVTSDGLAIPKSNPSIPQCCDNCLFDMLPEEELEILDDSFLTLHRFNFRRTTRYRDTKQYESEEHIAQVHKILTTEVVRNQKISPQVREQIREGLVSWGNETFSSNVKPYYLYLSTADFLSGDAIKKILGAIATIDTRSDLANVLEPLLFLESSLLAQSAESLLSCIREMRDRFELGLATNPEDSRPPKKRKHDFAHVPERQLDSRIPSQKALLEAQRNISVTDYASFERKEAPRHETANWRAAAYLEKRKISLYNEKAKQLNIPPKDSELMRESRVTQPRHRRSKNPELVC